MKVLLLGGTQFLGRHLVAAALAAGHEVTLFHRGRHPVATPGAVHEIHGDRTRHLSRLAGQRWDVVLDTCGYLPGPVGAAARLLRPLVGQYVFISSVAAYADFSQPNYTEQAPLAPLTAAQLTQAALLPEPGASTLGEAYGPLKAACEHQVRQVFGPAALLVRPGVLVGPHDPTDRLAYWLARLARGGEVLAPGRPQRYVQLLDARDLAAWLVRMAEQQAGGTFNVASPPFALTMGHLLAEAQAILATPATLTWVGEEFLRQQRVAEWSELPLYLAETGPDGGFLTANVDKALASKLLVRPLAATLADTWAWRQAEPAPLRAGLPAAREQALLRRWHATRGNPSYPGAARS